MTRTASVQTEGADIVYDYEGSGPLLLTIAAAGGDGGGFAEISELVSDSYTVVRYDRRCCSRSTGNFAYPLDIAQQARDAVAIIKDMGADKAFTFGSSAGGAISCHIASHYPEVVTGMIIHEPAIQTILPDGPDVIRFIDAVEEKLETEGTISAAKMFASCLKGVPRPGESEFRPRLLSGGNVEHFMRQEFHSISNYRPYLARLRANAVPIVTVSGRLSEDAFYARTAAVLAEKIGCPHRMMSGHHLSYEADPAIFAYELRALLEETQALA